MTVLTLGCAGVAKYETCGSIDADDPCLHNWLFYQLQQLITYKANLAGIRLVEVDPAYTSQTCPACGKRNHANDKKYQCTCGFDTHRDRLSAISILRQPVVDGNSLPA